MDKILTVTEKKKLLKEMKTFLTKAQNINNTLMGEEEHSHTKNGTLLYSIRAEIQQCRQRSESIKYEEPTPKVMVIGEAYDNRHNKFNYIKNLQRGDKLRAIKTTKSLGDVGMSGMTFEYDEFIKGKEYVVDSTTNWSGHTIAYVIDEDGTSCFAKPEIFELVN